jgi:hypothetical protein
LEVVHVVQRLRHYILMWKTIVVYDANPMKHILSRHIIGGRYSKWNVILQEFDLEYVSSKSKKSLALAELMSKIPQVDDESMVNESFPNDFLFLIDSSDPWYGYVLV